MKAGQTHRLIPITSLLTIVLFLFSACSTTPSKPKSAAGTGAATGAVIGGIAGSSSGQTTEGIIAGGLAGAVIGGIVGISQERKERNEQDRLAQERTYQQQVAKARAAEAKAKAELEEELKNKDLIIREQMNVITNLVKTLKNVIYDGIQSMYFHLV